MPRKGKNIYLRKDGRWEGRFVKGREDGKTKYGYVFGNSYEEAELKLADAQEQFSSEKLIHTFETVSSEWLCVQRPQLKPSSIAKYSNILRLYLLPEFGNKDITIISRADVQSFSREMLISGGSKAEGLAPKTVNSILSVLKNVFAYAFREKNLSVADIADVSIKQSQKPMRILSKKEQNRLSCYLCDDLSPRNLGILLCLYTGLRIGEICALKWEDIFIADQYLLVHKTMQRIQMQEPSKKKTKIVIQTPKSDCSIRKIPIPDEILELLISCKKNPDTFLLTGYAHIFVEP